MPRKARSAQASTPEKILENAEKIFSVSGYEGSSLRQIATATGVPVASITYHFGSKERLYRAIFEAHAPAILDQRASGLALARSEADPDKKIELVIKALILPMLRLCVDKKARNFARLIAIELSDPSAEKRGIFEEFFDPIANLMIDALQECFPHWTTAEVHWAYQSLLGGMIMVMIDNGRMARLSKGAISSDDVDQAVDNLVSIYTAGFTKRARSAASTNAPSPSR